MAGDPTLPRESGRRASGEASGHLTGGGSAVAGARLLRAGLLGRGIEESRSPQMHEAEGARLGLRYEYRLFDFDRLALRDAELPRLMTRLREEGFSGVNVTHPFKEHIVPHLDRLSSDAAAIGAVNTVVFDAQGTVGHNTDCWGFAESFRRGLSRPGLEEVVLLGAGGGGMAVARALQDLGVRRLAIFDTNAGKAARLVAAVNSDPGPTGAVVAEDREAALLRADGLVNATPVGMAKYPGTPIESRWLRPALWVAELIYFPAETELLRAAAAAGCDTLRGEGMAIFQAVKAFELITGLSPDAQEMAHHFYSNRQARR